jgi:hypothetical protein
MGLCASGERPAVSQDVLNQDTMVASQLQQDEKKEAVVRKLLLLGPGASGKS